MWPPSQAPVPLDGSSRMGLCLGTTQADPSIRPVRPWPGEAAPSGSGRTRDPAPLTLCFNALAGSSETPLSARAALLGQQLGPGEGDQTHFVVLGGGPVGLTLALRLVELDSRRLTNITVYDPRFHRDEDGNTRWLRQECSAEDKDLRVFHIPTYVLDRLGGNSEASKEAFEGEETFFGAKSIGSQELQDRLLARLQEADLESSITLLAGPPPYVLDKLQVGSYQDGLCGYRSWIEATESHLVVATDQQGVLAGQAFSDMLDPMQSVSGSCASLEPEEPLYILGAAVKEEEVRQPRALTSALNAAQRRYFYGADGLTKRGHLGVRLRRSEFDHAVEVCGSTIPATMWDRQTGPEETVSLGLGRLESQLPWLLPLIQEGAAMFDIDESWVESVMLSCSGGSSSSSGPRESPWAKESFTCNSGRGSKIAVLPDYGASPQDSTPVIPPCWGGRPGSGLTESLEAADALAKVLLSCAPLAAYESFARGLTKPRGQRGRKAQAAVVPEPPPDGSIESCVRAWLPKVQAPSSAPVSDEDLMRACQHNGGSTAARCWSKDVLATLVWPPVEDSAPCANAAEDRCGMFTKALEAWSILISGNPESALQHLDQALEEYGGQVEDVLWLTVRAEALLKQGCLKEARKACSLALKLDPRSTLGTLVRAEVNLRSGYLPDACEDCDAVVQQESGCAAAYALRGEARLGLGRAVEAVMDCDWALAHGLKALAVLTVRGAAHRLLGNLQEAFDDCDEALRIDPTCGEALCVRGQALLELGDARRAEADLSKVMETTTANGKSTSSLLSRALTARAEARVALQRYDEACRDCDEALTHGPCLLALAVRAEAKLLSGRYQEAVQDCTEVLASNPTDSFTFAIRAEARLRLGQTSEALQDCDQALELCPSLEFATSVRERALLGTPQAAIPPRVVPARATGTPKHAGH